MKLLYRREYSNDCVGEVYKNWLGFYAWKFYVPKIKKAIKKGLSFDFSDALIECNFYNDQLTDNRFLSWTKA